VYRNQASVGDDCGVGGGHLHPPSAFPGALVQLTRLSRGPRHGDRTVVKRFPCETTSLLVQAVRAALRPASLYHLYANTNLFPKNLSSVLPFIPNTPSVLLSHQAIGFQPQSPPLSSLSPIDVCP
jgi:hypothetical protein